MYASLIVYVNDRDFSIKATFGEPLSDQTLGNQRKENTLEHAGGN